MTTTTYCDLVANPFWEQTLVQSLWTYISLMQAGVFHFFTGDSSILNSNQHVQQWKEEAMLCEIPMCNFKSHFQQDFLAYRTRPVSVHLAMARVSCSFNLLCQLLVQPFFNLFAHFKKTKSHKKYVFLYPFSNMAISPKNNKKHVFYTSKLYELTGMQSHLHGILEVEPGFQAAS